MKVAQPYKERYFKEYNKQQMGILSENIKDLSAFIKLIQFSSDSNDQTDQLFAVEKAKLTEELYYKRKRMDNYNLAEDITLGCLAKCFLREGLEAKTRSHLVHLILGESMFVLKVFESILVWMTCSLVLI